VIGITDIIDREIGVEGGYSNNPNDPGGETMWGITVQNARLYGYMGEMKDMPRTTAWNIYSAKFVSGPHFDRIILCSMPIAAVIVDTGVNMGVHVASGFLQRALNIFNRQARDYPDIDVDFNVGPATIAALQAFLKFRTPDGESVMLKALNCLRGARYISIAEANPKEEDFEFGWFKDRIDMSSVRS
jgi:lysozyme family protein